MKSKSVYGSKSQLVKLVIPGLTSATVGPNLVVLLRSRERIDDQSGQELVVFVIDVVDRDFLVP